MRRPINEPVRITGDRASHALYGVGPATDYACPIGTPIFAPFAGQLSTYVTTEGGLGVILRGTHATFYGQHLRVRMTPGAYAEGDRIALSGNTGALTTGPHLHCYVIVNATSERLSMEEYLAATAATSSKPFTPNTPQGDTMAMATIRHPNGNIFFVDDLGADNLGDYRSSDIGLGEFLDAHVTVNGTYKQVTARQFDIAVAVAERRWAKKKAEIVAAVVAAIKSA